MSTHTTDGPSALPTDPVALDRVGQALVGLLFLVSGLLKIGRFDAISGVLAAKGLPLAGAATVLVIALEVGGGVALVLGLKGARWAAALLALFVVAATLLFHPFWSADAAAWQNQLNHFLKNLAILGALIALAGRPRAA